MARLSGDFSALGTHRRLSLDFNWSAVYEYPGHGDSYVGERRQSDLFFSSGDMLGAFPYLALAGEHISEQPFSQYYDSMMGMVPEYCIFPDEARAAHEPGHADLLAHQPLLAANPQLDLPRWTPQWDTYSMAQPQDWSVAESESSHSSFTDEDNDNGNDDDDGNDDEEYREPQAMAKQVNVKPWLYSDESDGALEHKMTRIKKGVYRCNHCEQKFNTMEQFYNHIAAEGIDRQFKCTEPSCPWSRVGFPNRNECNRHIKHQHAGSRYACSYDLCNKKFPRKDSRNRHESLVHEKPDSRLNRKLHRKQLLEEEARRRRQPGAEPGSPRFRPDPTNTRCRQRLLKKKSAAQLAH